MGTQMYWLRIAPREANLDGDSLLRLLPLDGDVGREFVMTRRMTGIEEAWTWLDQLFQGETPAESAHLPVEGGREVPCSEGAPVLVLDVEQVAAAAEFLADASFDQLWAANRAAVEAEYGGILSQHEIDDLRENAEDLKTFFSAAQQNGDAVMKWAAF